MNLEQAIELCLKAEAYDKEHCGCRGCPAGKECDQSHCEGYCCELPAMLRALGVELPPLDVETKA